MEIEKFESVQYWMDALAMRSEGTKDRYLMHFKAFCKAVGKTPDELIAQRRQDLKSDDLYKRHRIEMLLKKHIADLEKQEKSIGTQKLRYAAVRSFFECHYVRLELLRTDAPSGESIGKEPADKAQIKRMMSVASLKFRCLIAFLKDCGWRKGDVLRLKLGDINDMGDGYWNFKKVTKKERVVSNTFVGPETTELMELYWRKREESGEKMTPDSPLFPSEKGGFYKKFTWLSAKISEIAQLVGAKNVSAHSLRKYFQTTLENPELHIQKTWIKQYMGKALNPGDKPYVEHRTERLFEAYKRVYDHLRVIEVPKVSEEDRRIAALVDNARMLGVPEDQIEALLKERGKTWHKPSQLAMRMKAYTRRKETDTNGGGSTDCQKIVTEEQLEAYLAKGWRVQAVLPSGKIVISNEG